jgi:Zn-dependent protease with chaperone function
MPIFLILFVTAACLPIGWPAPPAGFDATDAILCVAGLATLPIAFAAVISLSAIRTLRGHSELRSATAQKFGRLRRLVVLLNFTVLAADLFLLGWGDVVRKSITWEGRLAPFAELLVPGPFLAVIAVLWLVYYPAERAIYAAGGSSRPYPSLTIHWLTQARRFILFVLLPAGLFAAEQTVSRYAPKDWQESPWFYLAGFAALFAGLAAMPLAMTRLLGMRPLPAGPRRDRFLALAQRLNVRLRDLLVWPTHHTLATAVMIGIVPRLRYVAFSDRLLDDLTDEELDAVFGHEVGHVKHRHVPYYLLFLVLSSTVVTAVVLAVARAVGLREVLDSGPWADAFIAVQLVTFGAYLFVVFGWLSRACERQADLFGARAVSCGRSDCAVHGPEDFPANGLAPMCPTGIRVFVNALQRVAYVNGLDPIAGDRPTVFQTALAWVRAWQHGPIPARIAFLRTLLLDPDRERTARRRIALIRWGLVAGLAVVAGWIVVRIEWTGEWPTM